MLNIMREFDLRAARTFFNNNRKYNTWLGLPNTATKKRQMYQLDHIFIPKLQLCHTTNVKHRFDGAPSYQAALSNDFYFLTSPLLRKKEPHNQTSPPKRINNYALCDKELSKFYRK
jgi:hypothetical protein